MKLRVETQFGPKDAVLVEGDLPDSPDAKEGVVGIDTETSGLDWTTDQLGLIQLYFAASSTVYLIRPTASPPKRLIRLLESSSWTKVFHFALFDLRFLASQWDFEPRSVRCTKVASKLLSPQKQTHSLTELLDFHLDVTMSKDQEIRVSEWTAEELSSEQLRYAALDVVFLPLLLESLSRLLERDRKMALADECFAFLPAQLKADLLGVEGLFEY